MVLLFLSNRIHGILAELNDSKKENGAVEVPHHKGPWLITGRQEKSEYVSNIKAISYEAPEFVPPFPLRIHPMAEVGRESTKDCLLRHSIDTLYSPQTLESFLFFPLLAARVYPDASLKGLELSCKFMTFTWLIDDFLDDIDIHKAWERWPSLFREINLVMASTFSNDETMMPECLMRGFEFQYASEQLNEDIKKVFETYNDEVFPEKLSLLGSAFREVWDEIVAETRREFCLRMVRYYQIYCISSLIQIQRNKDDVIPSLDDYVLLRRATSAVVSFVVIAEFTDGVALPEEVFAGPQMQRLLVLINDIVSWHNDIWSFKMDYLKKGDAHNLVFLISQSLQLLLPRSFFDGDQNVEGGMRGDGRCSRGSIEDHTSRASRCSCSVRGCVQALGSWDRRLAQDKLTLSMNLTLLNA